MEPGRYAVIDTETTGLDPCLDAVVSVAVVPVDDGVLQRNLARQILVDPRMPIPAEAFAVHGIRDEDVRGAADLATAIDQLRPLLVDRVVVGHNLPFDLAFLARAGFAAEQCLDTLSCSRLLWTRHGLRHTLDDAAARVGVQPADRHTALGDAIATAEVLVACLPLLRDKGLDSPQAVADAYRAQRRRRARVRRSIRRRSTRRRRPSRGWLRRSAHRRPTGA